MYNWFKRVKGGPHSVPPPPPASAPTAKDALARGNELLAQGNAADALRWYESACELDASSVDARVNLGFALLEAGRSQQAKAALLQALDIVPAQPDAHFMLGRLALSANDESLAIHHLENAVHANLGSPAAAALLARLHAQAGRTAQARSAVDRGLATHPQAAELCMLLGLLQLEQGDYAGAQASLCVVVRDEPQMADAHVHLGRALLLAGQHEEARSALQRALACQITSAATAQQLGAAFHELGSLDAAATAYRMALSLDAGHLASLDGWARLSQARGDRITARQCYERLTELNPDSPGAWCNLATACSEDRHYADAQRCCERALSIDPNCALAEDMLGVLANERGQHDQAVAHFEKSLRLDPDHVTARSHHLFMLNYRDREDEYAAAARAYGRLVSKQAKPFSDWLVGLPGPARSVPTPLRVGLVSGDLRAHPVGFFIDSVVPMLAQHGIALAAFPTSHHDDAVTRRLRNRCASWTPILGMQDEAAARMILAQGVHVLLDLAGHTAHNRLPVFAWRPAPVQASWLGYFASTGVAQIDHVIADPLCVPAGQERQFTESVWRLPDTRMCFTPPGQVEGLPVGALPALGNGLVTFGSFQNLTKLSDGTLHAWRCILERLPSARLRLQNKQTGVSLRPALISRLECAELPMGRIDIAPPAERSEYLTAYGSVDLLLDSFPFPGGTTTCEALWMGVPTVTLRGHSMVSNQGAALLECAGLEDWVALSADDYVRIAVERAADINGLSTLRRTLRHRVLASPLFDAPRFARHLAEALHGMWQADPVSR